MTPVQLIVGACEIGLLLGGAVLLLLAFLSPARREAWLGVNRLSPWALTGYEAALLFVTIFLTGFVGQGVLGRIFGDMLKHSTDRAALEVIVYGVGFHGFALLGWPLFGLLRRHLYTDYGAEPPAVEPSPRLPSGRLLLTAAATLCAALPVLSAISLGWTFLLEKLGLPAEPQDLLAIFSDSHSPAVAAGMLFVACVLAPVNEELLFRAGFYRYCRQRWGRAAGLLLSATCFAALHGNLAGFLPLALLGAALALAYERTGDIRVPIAMHALFNLNTVLILASGLPQT